jgi:hypothetical protein
MEYNKSIRDLAQNLNLTTEATSRIVQTADDFTVSQDAVTSALQMAVKKGMAPNIDTLAKMADEYNSISDPTERAARLTEVFGRNWTALTPMLKEGGQAIRDAAAAQDDALLVTEAQSKATRDLEVNIDNLGDKFLALKLKVGNAVIPVLNEAITTFDYFTEGLGSADEVENEMARGIANAAVQFGAESGVVEVLSQKMKDYLIIKQQVGQTDTEQQLRAEMGAVKELSVTYSESEVNMAAFSSTVANQSAQWRENTDLLYNAALGMKSLTEATIYNQAAAGLDAEAAYKLGEAMGLIPAGTDNAVRALNAAKATYAETGNLDRYISRTKELAAAIESLQSKDITITQTTIIQEIMRTKQGESGEKGGLIGGGRAGGGPVAESVPVNVNELNRERFVPYAGGSMVPAANNLGPVSIVVNAAPGQNVQQIAQAVSSILARKTRSMINGGYSNV